MLVENKEPRARAVGDLILIPGVNRVDKDKWKYLLSSGYKKVIEGLIDSGIMGIQDEGKLTVSIVQNTYDVRLLEEWLGDSKGPLKGAIKKQIALMTEDDKEAV